VSTPLTETAMSAWAPGRSCTLLNIKSSIRKCTHVGSQSTFDHRGCNDFGMCRCQRYTGMAGRREEAWIVSRLRINRHSIFRHDAKPAPLPYKACLCQCRKNPCCSQSEFRGGCHRHTPVTCVFLGCSDHQRSVDGLPQPAARKRQAWFDAFSHEQLPPLGPERHGKAEWLR